MNSGSGSIIDWTMPDANGDIFDINFVPKPVTLNGSGFITMPNVITGNISASGFVTIPMSGAIHNVNWNIPNPSKEFFLKYPNGKLKSLLPENDSLRWRIGGAYQSTSKCSTCKHFLKQSVMKCNKDYEMMPGTKEKDIVKSLKKKSVLYSDPCKDIFS